MSIHQGSVETRRSYERTADRIRALIGAGRLNEGARLPAVRDLASQLGVSRQSLREALIALEIDGLIEIRGKVGIYVCPPARRRDLWALSVGGSPGELLQARVVLESEVTMLAAARVSSLGLHRVEEALEEMRDGLARGYEPVEADRRFHLSIAEQSANSVLVEMIGALFDAWHPMSSRTRMRVETVRNWQSVLHEHESILRALKSRHPQAAAAEMCLHLQSSHGRWIGEPTPPSSPSVLSSPRRDSGFDVKGARSDAVRRNFISLDDSSANHWFCLGTNGSKPGSPCTATARTSPGWPIRMPAEAPCALRSVIQGAAHMEGGHESAPVPWAGVVGPDHDYQASRARCISLGTSSFDDRIGAELEEAMSLHVVQLEQLPVISKKETAHDEKVDSTRP
jgi:DNA-binding FadR family transcriptional regulator